MLANELCLHNPDGAAREYVVERPDLPPGLSLTVAGKSAVLAPNRVRVEVPAHGTVRVEILSAHARVARPVTACTIPEP